MSESSVRQEEFNDGGGQSSGLSSELASGPLHQIDDSEAQLYAEDALSTASPSMKNQRQTSWMSRASSKRSLGSEFSAATPIAHNRRTLSRRKLMAAKELGGISDFSGEFDSNSPRQHFSPPLVINEDPSSSPPSTIGPPGRLNGIRSKSSDAAPPSSSVIAIDSLERAARYSRRPSNQSKSTEFSINGGRRPPFGSDTLRRPSLDHHQAPHSSNTQHMNGNHTNNNRINASGRFERKSSLRHNRRDDDDGGLGSIHDLSHAPRPPADFSLNAPLSAPTNRPRLFGGSGSGNAASLTASAGRSQRNNLIFSHADQLAPPPFQSSGTSESNLSHAILEEDGDEEEAPESATPKKRKKKNKLQNSLSNFFEHMQRSNRSITPSVPEHQSVTSCSRKSDDTENAVSTAAQSEAHHHPEDLLPATERSSDDSSVSRHEHSDDEETPSSSSYNAESVSEDSFESSSGRLSRSSRGSSMSHGVLSEDGKKMWVPSESHDGDHSSRSRSSYNSDKSDGDEENTLRQDDDEELYSKKWFGVDMPPWFPAQPKLDQIALKVTMYAPCFWICPFQRQTYRAILGRLNILLSLMTLLPICTGIFLLVVLADRLIVDRSIDPNQVSIDLNHHRNVTMTTEDPGTDWSSHEEGITAWLWTLNGSVMIMSFASFVLLVGAVVATRVVRNVDIVGAIRYVFMFSFVLPLLIYCAISLFDYFGVTKVWIKHWWRHPQMAWFRRQYCPTGTYQTLCTVPVSATPYGGDRNGDETLWCLRNYNSTDCTQMRDFAQALALSDLIGLYTASGFWAIFLAILSFLSCATLEKIISKPLIEKAKKSTLHIRLLLPTFVCLMFGFLFTFAQEAVLKMDPHFKLTWLGPAYVVAGGLFLAAGILGWYISNCSILSTLDKRKNLCAVAFFIATMVLAGLLLTVLFSTCISFTGSFIQLPLDDEARGTIACALDYHGSCTGCIPEGQSESLSNTRVASGLVCPEWSSADVTIVLQTQAKASATVAAIMIVYAVHAVRSGLRMRRHLVVYQIEYV